MRSIWRSVLIAVAIAIAAPTAEADDTDPDVDLELVLAVDVSGSMDLDEQRVQRDGYVAAFRHPDVIRAITSGPYRRIAVTYLEWAGARTYYQLVPWRVLGGEEDARAFADALAAAPISGGRWTSISRALSFARAVLHARPANQYARRTIDISGDGANNDGSPVLPMRDRIVKEGIVINGLPILIRPSTLPRGITLDQYYEACVIGGPGSFTISVTDVADFEEAIRRKLILEIAGVEPTVMRAAETLTPSSVDCLIGERTRDPYR